MSTIIIDYGMGNVESVQKALNLLNIDNRISNNSDDIKNAKYLILPGVGSFAKGMENLKQNDLDKLLTNEVLVKKKPFLGICLGMQLLASVGTEPTETKGLGWINGKIIKMKENKRIPHLGWNSITSKNAFFDEFNDKDFYFIHSYHFHLENENHIGASVNYGNNYVAAIQFENIYATQFHPEKSQEFGLKLISNFFTENA